jgi:hypothetical protein
MFFVDELYLRAVLADRARDAAALAPGRAFRRVQRALLPPATWPLPVSAAQRVQQLLAESYGQGQAFGADPDLFTRLAWVGIDD